ncbi:BAG family molecular chaperone regulator 4 [Quillaja saponaria]|uniref:BAG family molecular chaperone regulator 4 n=1 Tax=Quillaja saponaria TaxID=32244 RepID=A0AAD7LN91_QUISA|nr:BAG family molecular chaperone regulator 4 [Quillaja saponaria]
MMKRSSNSKEEVPNDNDGGASYHGPMIKINVSHGSSQNEVYVPAQSTFGDIKKALAHKTGLEPQEQRLFFRGIEKEDGEHLHMEGVKDKSKLLLLEESASKERKFEEMEKRNQILKACEAVAGIRAEVDKLSERVTTLEVSVNGGTKVDEKEFVVSTELLMRQLLKLDGIEAEGEAKVQRKAEVHRVQNFVDTVDNLKVRNSSPFSGSGTAVSVTTQWETFDSGMESSSAPASVSPSTKVTQDWEQFD